jgi:hypothetical protein
MRKVILLLVLLLSGCGTLWDSISPGELAAMQKQDQEQRIAQIMGLAPIRKLYLGSFGVRMFSVREDVIKLLKSETTRFEVVEDRANADAEMIAVNVDTSYPAIRLLDIKKATVIWSFECQQQTILWSNFQKLGCDPSEIVGRLLDDTKVADDYATKNSAKDSVPDIPAANKMQ